ncbi:MAG: membrane lipoprotein lipid attachment site-containing protein [Bacilli bacterium]|nr:membrane lipoprotein lipid attachment site-containing protein [Bacilli bacterium]
MYRKKIVFLLVIALILTGCTRIDSNIDNIISATMNKEIKDVNTVSTGYELYIPIGVMQLVDNEYNQKFEIRDTHVYLYVDTISYYYKNSLNYKNIDSYNYYYKEISLNNKTGYVGVSKLDDGSFFVNIVYNYSKIEFYTNEENLPFIISNSLIIINSIKFNDNLIKIELEKITSDNREVKYELDKPDDSKSTFNQYLQEFVDEEESEVLLPDIE